jgi:hypothetical protein
VSITQDIWVVAREAFGNDVFKAWPQICERWEHALWEWNDRFGPLNRDQREYASQLCRYSLAFAGETKDAHRYARFHSRLAFYLNHERVAAKFKALSQPIDLGEELGPLVDGAFQEVPV